MNPDEKVNILIVDDRPDKIAALQAVLSDLDLNLVCVQSGREALCCLLTQDFATILLDVNMPIMDGFETASLIRQLKSTHVTPIIFITSYCEDPIIAQGYALGAVDYLITPVVPAILRTKVSFFADLYRHKREITQQKEKLQHRSNQLSMLAAEVAAVEHRERKQLAQIIHDNLQQLLVAARFHLVEFKGASPQAQNLIIAEVDGLLNQSIQAARGLTAELSPPVLHDAGLVPALEWLARRMKSNHGLAVEVQSPTAIDIASDNLRIFVFNVVRECLFNCLKHSGVTTATISVAREANDRVKVSVSDAGQGFDASLLESPTLDKDHFGLFSIRERASMLNGNLQVISAPGRGTTVVLTLPDQPPMGVNQPPLATPQPAPVAYQAAAATPDNPPPAPGANIRVIIVDDHEIIRKGLVAILQHQCGIEVVGEAANGLIAVEMSRALHPDVMIMDISMPGMNGIEATRIIKMENPDVRIIGLSLHTQEDMSAAMILVGASAYLPKDGPPEALIDAIRQSTPASAAEENELLIESQMTA